MRGVVLGGAFVILWWFALLILLPIGAHAEEGAEPAVPVKTQLLRKAAIATAIAVVLWGIFYVLVLAGLVTI
jgi:predicted secreted protein